MLCLKCHAGNDAQNKFCKSCGAVLPRNIAFGQAISRLDLKEGESYARPDRSYPNSQIDELEKIIHEFLDGHVSEDDVFEVAENLEDSAAEVLSSIPRAMEAAKLDQHGRDDEIFEKLPYMLGTGAELLNTALNDLDLFLSGEDLDMEALLTKFRESNDYLCYSAHLIQTLFEEASRV